MRKYPLASFLAVLAILPLAAFADMLPDNFHAVRTCFRIDNDRDYQGYDLLVTGEAKFPFTQKFENGQSCFDSGFNEGRLLAIRRADWGKVTYSNDQEMAGSWPTSKENQALIFSSNLILKASGPITDENSLKQDDVTIHIDSISDNLLTAHVVEKTAPPVSTTVSRPTATAKQLSQLPAAASIKLPVAIGTAVGGLLGLIVGFFLWKKRAS